MATGYMKADGPTGSKPKRMVRYTMRQGMRIPTKAFKAHVEKIHDADTSPNKPSFGARMAEMLGEK